MSRTCKIVATVYDMDLKKSEWHRLLALDYWTEVVPSIAGTGADEFSIDYDKFSPNKVWFSMPNGADPGKTIAAIESLVAKPKLTAAKSNERLRRRPLCTQKLLCDAFLNGVRSMATQGS